MKNGRNCEGYSDPTASRAIARVSWKEEREAERRAYNLTKALKCIVSLCGFKLNEEIQVTDMKTGVNYPRKGKGE